MNYYHRILREEDGVLSFEWTLLVTVLTIGIVTGLAAARDGIVDELGDAAQAMLALDQSFTIDFGLDLLVHTTDPAASSDSRFTDALLFSDCDRQEAGISGIVGQLEVTDEGDGETSTP